MRPIGFSTGSLAFGDFAKALLLMRGKGLSAVELSALREIEVEPLVQAIAGLDLREFAYLSFHAPSRLRDLTERELVERLRPIHHRRIPIVLHPDVIQDAGLWREFGSLLLIENMDKRKPIGRTAVELDRVFADVPEANLCLDLGHARQVDPTMSRAGEILRNFTGKLAQLHLSEVNSSSHHEPLNVAAIDAIRSIAHLVPPEIPAILESTVTETGMESEVQTARAALTSARGAERAPVMISG